MKRTTILLLLISFVMLSCKEKTTKSDDPVIYADANDKELEQAKIEALTKIDFFIESFNKHSNDTVYMFSLKKDFVENGEHEHMWVIVKKIENNKFVGILDNEPQTIRDYRLGDKVTMNKEEIEDWVIYNSTTQEMEGGYSIKVFQNRQK